MLKLPLKSHQSSKTCGTNLWLRARQHHWKMCAYRQSEPLFPRLSDNENIKQREKVNMLILFSKIYLETQIETSDQRLGRFQSLTTKERKLAVAETCPEWTKDAAEMEFGSFIEKWSFLTSIEGLFLAYRTMKGLKNLDHLVKRLKRLMTNVNGKFYIFYYKKYKWKEAKISSTKLFCLPVTLED